MLKQLYFSEGTLGQNLLAKDIGDLLDGDALASLPVVCSASAVSVISIHCCSRCIPNNAICTLAELFRHSVFLIDNEVLVEDLEDLPACEVCHVGVNGRCVRLGVDSGGNEVEFAFVSNWKKGVCVTVRLKLRTMVC